MAGRSVVIRFQRCVVVPLSAMCFQRHSQRRFTARLRVTFDWVPGATPAFLVPIRFWVS